LVTDTDRIAARVNSVKYWRHRIDFGNGVVSPGRTDSRIFEALNLCDLRGKAVLDIGASDGLFSFECERRGASRVLAIDVWESQNEETLRSSWGESIEAFLTAKEILGSGVEYKKLSVYEVSPETVGVFDIVLFLGVLYHLQDPFLALRKIATVTKELLVVESHAIRTLTKAPMMRFYPGRELDDNPRNWWGPNLECIRHMLLASGFRKVESVYISPLTICAIPFRIGFPKRRTEIRARPDGGELASIGPGRLLLVLGKTSGQGQTWYRVEVRRGDRPIQGWIRDVDVAVIGLGVSRALRLVKYLSNCLFRYRAVVKAYK